MILSGYTALIACGTTQDCENGSSAGGYREAIQREWRRESRYPGADQAFLDWIFDKWFIPALQRGFNGQRSADAFGVVFMDTGGWWENGKDFAFGAGDVGPFVRANIAYFGPRGADLWIGYSFGGVVAWSALNRNWNTGGALPMGLLLLQAAIGHQYPSIPGLEAFGGFDPRMLRAVRVVTINDPDAGRTDWTWKEPWLALPIPGLPGAVAGAANLVFADCGGSSYHHCTHRPHQAPVRRHVKVPTRRH